ncbi:MAG: HEAT repeat domain-containing protein [Microcystaceae cyanobacterium]
MGTDIQKLINTVDQADSAQKLTDAVQDLANAKDKAAIPTLITVLGYNNPGAAVAAVEGLVALGETAIPQILEKIDGYNYGARAWAIRACSGIGDPRALSILEEAAKSDFALSVRRAAAKGLGNIKWSNISENNRLEAQQNVLNVLLEVCKDGEWVVRYAAIVALESLLKTQKIFQTQIIEYLRQMGETDEDLTVRARIQKVLNQDFF